MRIRSFGVISPRAAIAFVIASLLLASLPSDILAGSAPITSSRTRLRPLNPAEVLAEPTPPAAPVRQDEQQRATPWSEVEAASARQNAEVLKPGTLYTGTLESDAGSPAVRLYGFEATAGTYAIASFALDIGPQPGAFDTTVTVLDVNGAEVPFEYSNKIAGIMAEEGQVYAVAVPSTGVYFVRVTGSSTAIQDSAAYRLALRLTERPTYRISPLVTAGQPLLEEINQLQRRREALDVEIEAFGRTPATNEKQGRILERMGALRDQLLGNPDAYKLQANSACVSGSLSGTEATYNRPTTSSTAGSCATSGNVVRYDSYEFALSGCTSFPTTVTISLCNTSCGTSDATFDSFISVYQAAGGSGGPFSAASPCTNFVAQNADGPAGTCAAAGGVPGLSHLTASLNSGNFVVVVSSQFTPASPPFDDTGNYFLSVSATASGCNITQPGVCNPITVSSTPNPPASSVTVNSAYPSTDFDATGGTAPYTFSATGLPSGMSINSSSGVLSGTPTVAGLYHVVVTALDVNTCGGTNSFDLTVTNQALPCITDILTTSSTTFEGIDVNDGNANGIDTPCADRNVNLYYKAYEFNLTGCASATLTATTCGTGGCSPLTGSGALPDTVIYLYRTGGSATAGTGTQGAFNPGSPCTNLVRINDQRGLTSSGGLGSCAADSDLSGFTGTIGPGRFTIVVSGGFAGQVGAFNLSVTTTGSGCSLALAGACAVSVTPSPNPVPAGAVNTPYTTTTFMGSGGTAPYTITHTGTVPPGMTFNDATGQLSGTPTAQGFYPLTVFATDANSCIGSLSVNLVITGGSPPCITDNLATGGATFNGPNRDDTLASGVPASCSLRGQNLLYKAYEFNVSGCSSATLTATTCGSGGCAALTGQGALPDSMIYIYRSGGSLTAGTGVSGAFNPASPCTNLVAINDQQGTTSSGGLGACGADVDLAGLIRTIGPGVFTIVVSGAFPSNSGAYNLNVTLSGSGCSLCSVINGTLSGGGTVCPGGPANISATITGGTAPYTVTLNNGGGTVTSASPVNFTVSPASTTTYSVMSATDSTGCPVTFSGSATVTVGSCGINPTSMNFVAAGGSSSVAVTAAPGSTWNAVSNDSFIMITSGSSGTGNGTVNYTVSANPGPGTRMGTMTIAGQTFTVTQDAPCVPPTIATNPSSQTVCPGATVMFTASANGTSPTVQWQFNSGSGFSDIAGATSTTLTGTAGTAPFLSGNLFRAIFTNACGAVPSSPGTLTLYTQSINPTSMSFGSAGGSDSVSVTDAGSCGWTAVSNDSWIMITSGMSGTGNGTVNYSVSANTGPARSGTMTIANQTFTVNQGDGCKFTINPSSASYPAAGGSNSVAVTASDPGCMWSAVSNDTWIVVTSCHAKTNGAVPGCSFTGNGSVDYTVNANPNTTPRSGTITIGGNTFTVNQAGACAPPTPSSITGATSVIAGDADLDSDMLPGYTYSVPSQGGATYTWSVSSGATIYGGQGTTSIQVVFDNSAGPFTISVVINTGCGTDNPSLMATKTHNGFSWQFVGTGTPGGWTPEVGTWQQNTGYENPAHIVGGTIYESASYGQVYGDFSVETSIVVTRDGSTSGAATTLWLRGTPQPTIATAAQRWNHGYAFNIANTGRFSIFRYSATGNTTLQSWVAPVGTTINTDGVTPNVLKVTATGGTLQFYINGVLVKTLTSQTIFPTGEVGVALIRTTSAPADVLKVNYAKLAPAGFPLPKAAATLDELSLEQERANAEANRLRPNANPLFDRQQ